jgi:hypothetical protein
VEDPGEQVTQTCMADIDLAGQVETRQSISCTMKYPNSVQGNTQNIYHLCTDNQAAEHIAAQPNMNDHSRSIDIRIHDIRQDYLDNARKI